MIRLVRFEPSHLRGQVTVTVPRGAVPLLARVSPVLGDGELVVQADAAAPVEQSLDLLFLWEGDPAPAVVDLAKWRLIGSWSYQSGGWQHCFAPVVPASKKAPAVA